MNDSSLLKIRNLYLIGIIFVFLLGDLCYLWLKYPSYMTSFFPISI